MSPKLISVVIPTRDRNATLALCLDRLAPGAQTLPHDQYEVVVSDDSAGHLAFELVRDRYPWARWQEGPQTISGYAPRKLRLVFAPLPLDARQRA